MPAENDWAPEPHSLFSLAVDEVIRLTTVGIDIGSSTSQLSFSEIELQRINTRYVVTDRRMLYESPIILTPFTDPTTIDTDALQRFFDEQYGAAGMTVGEVDSGAIILTGLALAKHNSRAIADVFSAEAGKLVAVSAGDAIEATLAARGAGVEALSREPSRAISHIDMGGGTVKYAFVVDGELRRVGAVDIGARLIVTDDDGIVLRIEPPAAMMLETIGARLAVGDRLDADLLEAYCAHAAEQVLAHAGLLPEVTADERLLRTPPLFAAGSAAKIDAVTFSGGVSEYIYDREPRLFNDTGRPLATAVVTRLKSTDLTVLEPAKGIRATVLGASQHSVQLSGNTVFASDEGLVPIRNIPVVDAQLVLVDEELDVAEMTRRLRQALAARDRSVDTDTVALALHFQGSATYGRLDALAQALVASTEPEVLDGEVPLVVVLDIDVANLLGHHLQRLGGENLPVLVLDGIEVSEFDFLDVGEFVPGTGALPVVVKSLLFPHVEN